MDKETLIKRNAIHGLESAIELSNSMVHLRKEHAKAILALLKEQEKDLVTIVWHDLLENPLDLPKRTAWYVCKIRGSDDLRAVYGYENITPEHYDLWAMIKRPI